MLTILAVMMPLICAMQAPPLPAFYSQIVACLLWSCVILVRSTGSSRALCPGNRLAAAPWFMLLVVLAAHVLAGVSPFFSVAPGALNILLAALISLSVFGGGAVRDGQTRWLAAVLIGVLLAALGNALVVAVQAFAPSWPDDTFIARHVAGERYGGNLRQPNQLATLAVWGLIAAAYLLRRWPWLWAATSLPLVATLFSSESRTGVISLLLVALIGLFQSRRVRAWGWRGWVGLALVLIPLVIFSTTAFTRSTADSSFAQRIALWRDVLTLIEQNPWFGVGWGQLNFAWTLTPFAQRAPDVFDHAHSLPLQLAVELGVPAATLILGTFLWGGWRIARTLWHNATPETTTATMLLAVMLIHSLFEYPLWFSYFLLPSAFLFAWLLRACGPAESEAAASARNKGVRSIAVAMTSLLCATDAIFAVFEYQKATAIHQNSRDRDALASAVATARASKLYGHFGDYAAIMLASDRAELSMFNRPVRHVLDERLLTAWARALERSGDTERAAYVIARAREFPPNSLFNDLPNVRLQSTRSASAPALGPSDFRGR